MNHTFSWLQDFLGADTRLQLGRLTALGAALFIGTGCPAKADITIKVLNPRDATAKYEAQLIDDNGELRDFADVVLQAPADGAPFTEGKLVLKDAQASWKVRTHYKPLTGFSKLPGDEWTIPISLKGRSVEVGRWNSYDPQNAESLLKTLATSVKPNPTVPEYGRIEEMMKFVGALAIIPQTKIPADSEEFKRHVVNRRTGFIWIADVPIDLSEVKTAQKSTETTKETFMSAAVNVPLYADLASQLSAKNLYSLQWEIKHTKYTIPVDPKAMIPTLGPERLKILNQQLALHPNHTLTCSPTAMYLIIGGSYLCRKAKKFNSSASLSASSFVTVDGEYGFSDEEINALHVPGIVVDVEFSCMKTGAIKSWIDNLITGDRRLTPPREIRTTPLGAPAPS